MWKNERADEAQRMLVLARPDLNRCNNFVKTSRYTLLSFLPKSIFEQFRRVANLYFLIVGGIMSIGYYTYLFETAVSPWTTIGPLAVILACSMIQEGVADIFRHRSDSVTNNHPCVVLRRSDELDAEKGKRDTNILDGDDVLVNLQQDSFFPEVSVSSPKNNIYAHTCKIAFESIKRRNIRQGHIVLVRNREMIPADLILLASSSESGIAYVETSSIDGETNLKLRASARFPGEKSGNTDEESYEGKKKETLEEATRRICNQTALGFPEGNSTLENTKTTDLSNEIPSPTGFRMIEKSKSAAKRTGEGIKRGFRRTPSGRDIASSKTRYIAAMKSEIPNASVNTFNGVLMLPPVDFNDVNVEIPLGAENLLLRGAVLRNTEWVIGISCFTGKDTKLVMNSVKTPSKLSEIDRLMNKAIVAILWLMAFIIAVLATLYQRANIDKFDELWYIGLNKNETKKWPYLPQDFDSPEWKSSTQNWAQVYMLFITLISNFVPLSLYITFEVVVVFMRVMINKDLDMYDPYTDTPAVARSSTVTDLGQVEYIFSDKTGTLTQNVMRFKRCSVDGMVFGSPVSNLSSGNSSRRITTFHPFRQLLVGKISPKLFEGRHHNHSEPSMMKENKIKNVAKPEETSAHPLTFNSEMFLRIMCLCHTVVVEKDLDTNQGEIKSTRNVNEAEEDRRILSEDEELECIDETLEKGVGGAPMGYAYQAESPDEGALVEASSMQFNFQLIGRDSTGIKLLVSPQSLFLDNSLVEKLKKNTITEDEVAVDTRSPDGKLGFNAKPSPGPREEKWELLAVNKFDSTRKRMSVLVRSPPELGAIPMLLCKGADSAMLDYKVARNSSQGSPEDRNAEVTPKGIDKVRNRTEDVDFDESNPLLLSHLAEFAKEGLRTLVLGMKVLSEDECSKWLEEYNAAATSIRNREEKMTQVALNIENNLHIVGATAIEDKLQVGVPETIESLGKAGIKVWVLTGDKRETAKEIGYATNVLREEMRAGMIEVAKAPTDEIHLKIAMAFLKLVKLGKLPEYQKSAIDGAKISMTELINFKIKKLWRYGQRSGRLFWHRYIRLLCLYCCSELPENDKIMADLKIEKRKEKGILQPNERRQKVRYRAEDIVKEYLITSKTLPGSKDMSNIRADEEMFLHGIITSIDEPDIFDKAQSARAVLQKHNSHKKVLDKEIRDLALANLTAQEASLESPLIDEDILSMKSFVPTDEVESTQDFDRMKRTLLERLFSTDKAVRHGLLRKHLTAEKVSSIEERYLNNSSAAMRSTKSDDNPFHSPGALVIEGSALETLLGDSQLEELLFAIASTCESVIACRVSPAQKADLVQLVRHYVVPQPVTLAIGDGANDVGMIQKAHVGVGISGKEGQQAVNASDFAIAQFRFLQELLLIHGRWNFMRMVQVVLFTFYKNTIVAGCLILFCQECLYSGTPFFDQWNVAAFNFIATAPIIGLGFFDRCLDKEYVKRNPEVYTPTRRNELITRRTFIRWVILAFLHILILYYLSILALAVDGGGNTSAFLGLMKNKSHEFPGEGEAQDLKSVGIVSFTGLVLMLALKVLLELRSWIIGQFPAIYCRKDSEGWPSRLAWTSFSIIWWSIGFYIFHIMIYQALGYPGPGEFSPYVELVYHAFDTRSRTWVMIVLLPIACIVVDMTGKLFSNMFFPTQTQIHVEIFAKQLKEREVNAAS